MCIIFQHVSSAFINLAFKNNVDFSLLWSTFLLLLESPWWIWLFALKLSLNGCHSPSVLYDVILFYVPKTCPYIFRISSWGMEICPLRKNQPETPDSQGSVEVSRSWVRVRACNTRSPTQASHPYQHCNRQKPNWLSVEQWRNPSGENFALRKQTEATSQQDLLIHPKERGKIIFSHYIQIIHTVFYTRLTSGFFTQVYT